MFNSRSIHVPAIFVATVLSLGFFVPMPVEAADDCGATYTIKRGDSLGKIAKKCGTTVNGIIAANDRIKNASQISVGWTIQLPVQDVSTVVSEPALTKDAPSVTVLNGRIFNSRSCAQLRTADGEVYGLVSRKLLFRSGQSVTVRGAFAEKTGCSADKVLMVSELETVVK